MKRLLLGILIALALGWLVLSVVVELEPAYRMETLFPNGPKGRALVLYHPSRDARFSEALSLAAAGAFAAEGFAVDRATMTGETPAAPSGYRVIAVVTNTYYWHPDLPTMRFLGRARFDSLLVIGLVGGAGSTGPSERALAAALRTTGGTVYAVRPFWLWRPNDESRHGVPNRRVAEERAAALVREAVRTLPLRPPQ